MLLTEYTYFLEDNELDETDEPPAKRPARENDDEDPNKLWGCLSEIISQSTSSSRSEVSFHSYFATFLTHFHAERS